MSYLVLARKYRPRTFSEMVGQEHVVRALTNALQQQRLHHAYLFTGTRGVGKTTVSRALAKSLNCEQGITPQPCGTCAACRDIDAGRFVDYTELDAASNRGVDEVQQLLEQAVYKPVEGRFKVFMIDEVHMLTNTAFNAMLKTLEEPPDYLKFVLATTDPQKVPVTVLSRCLQFNLRPMATETIQSHLAQVLETESVAHDEDALRLISHAARGSMRDALSLTDQAIAFGGGQLLGSGVRQMLGSVDRSHVFTLLRALASHDGAQLVSLCQDLRESGLSAGLALEDMARVLQRAAVHAHAPQESDADPDGVQIAAMAGLFHADEIQFLYSLCIHGRAELGLAPDEYTGMTMVLLRYLAFTAQPSGTAEKKTLNDVPRVVAVKTARPVSEISSPPAVTAAPRSALALPNAAERPRSVTELPLRDKAEPLPTPPSATRPVAPQPPRPTVEAVPVRQLPQVSQPAQTPLPEQTLTPTPEGDFWLELVQQLIDAQSIQSLARELALQSQLVARDADSWLLRIERESLQAGQSKEKLQVALTQAGHPVLLSLEMGRVSDSPARRMAHAARERLLQAQQIIEQDPQVQQWMQRYDAKIVPGSIQPL
ncbi:MAG: DNA polymerase III subunit gamma/tau [Alphaproteobacteria bacterium]|nr:DNA polymerase III subunit gamma/tau [Alphaproteobacteria bacterium]